jgi:hypothetical protein
MARENSINWNSHIVNIPAFGNFAYLAGPITAANVSTYIASAAIGDAHVSTLNAAKLRAGMIDALDINVRYGSINVIDSNNANKVRMKIGHAPGYAYGFYCYDGNGIVTFEASAVRNYLNGAIIGNAEIGTLKLAGESVIVPRSASTTVAKLGNGAFQQVLSFTITIPQPARLLMFVSLSQGFNAGSKPWIVRGQIYKSDGSDYFVDRSGGAYNDAPALSGDCLAPAGTHTCVVWWQASDSTVRMGQANMVVMGAMR